MTGSDPNPYQTLGVSPDVSDAQLRSAYRRLVLLHHPDHNNGSRESARRFEAVQAAYAEVLARRRAAAAATTPPAATTPNATGASRASGADSTAGRTSGARAAADPSLDARIAAMERELQEARAAKERARQDAMRAAADVPPRATPEELGYVTTDDSISKILDDVHKGLADRWSKSREEPLAKRLTDLFGGSE